MEKIFIIGATEYSFMINSMIKLEGQYEVLGHTVSEQYVEDNLQICKKKNTCLYAFEKLQDVVGEGKTVNVLNTIGYSNMNRTREKMFDQCIENGYKLINYISSKAICFSDIKGKGNIVFPGAYIGTNVDIGHDNVIYSGTVLTHDISVGNHNFFAANTTVGGVVHIGNNCFVGMGAVIRNRLEIADFTLVGAGVYLDVDTEKEAVFVPPKALKLKKKSREVHLIPQRK